MPKFAEEPMICNHIQFVADDFENALKMRESVEAERIIAYQPNTT